MLVETQQIESARPVAEKAADDLLMQYGRVAKRAGARFVIDDNELIPCLKKNKKTCQIIFQIQ